MDTQPVIDEVRQMMCGLSKFSFGPDSVENIIKKVHVDFPYREEHGHYWVSPSGDWGWTKPAKLSGSYHSVINGRKQTNRIRYIWWPNRGKGMVYVKTKDEARMISDLLILCNAYNSLCKNDLASS